MSLKEKNVYFSKQKKFGFTVEQHCARIFTFLKNNVTFIVFCNTKDILYFIDATFL